MLSSVLKSKRAVHVNVEIMRAFVRLRHILTSHKVLARKMAELEKKYDAQFRVVFDAIRRLMKEEEKPKRHLDSTRKNPANLRLDLSRGIPYYCLIRADERTFKISSQGTGIRILAETRESELCGKSQIPRIRGI